MLLFSGGDVKYTVGISSLEKQHNDDRPKYAAYCMPQAIKKWWRLVAMTSVTIWMLWSKHKDSLFPHRIAKKQQYFLIAETTVQLE